MTIHAYLLYGFRLDVQTYAWLGDNQWISRIGLIGEVTYETPIDSLSVGYGHHSWHNIDTAGATFLGRQQNWLFARIDLPKIEIDDATFLRFSVKPSVFVTDRDPLFIKDVYGPNEVRAVAMLAFPVIGAIHAFGFEIQPYIQFGGGAQRVGISAEFEYEITPFLAPIFSADFAESTNGRSETMIGIGLKIKFKR